MGCVSSKEEASHYVPEQISGPVGVRRVTQNLKLATGGLPAGIYDQGPSPRTEETRAFSEQQRAQVMEEAGRLVVVKTPRLRAGEVVPKARTSEFPPKPRTGEIVVKPHTGEIGQRPRTDEMAPKPRTGEVSAKARTGEIAVGGGERGSFAPLGSQSPLKEAPQKHHRKSSVTLTDAMTPISKIPSITKSEVDAFVSAVARDPLPVPGDIAVGKCGTVSFSNPLKGSTLRPENLGGPPKPSPKPPTPSKRQTFVSSWLLDLNLPQYAAAFEAAGYDEADSLDHLSEADLAQIESFSRIHILPGHKKRLMLASARPLLGQTPSTTPSPTEQVVLKNPLLQDTKLSEFEPLSENAHDGASSRATDSNTSSPASVLPTLVLPKHIEEATNALNRSQTFLTAEGKPLPAFTGKPEDEKLTFLGKESRHSKSILRIQGPDLFANGGSQEHLLGTPREGKVRNSKESPQVLESSQQLVMFEPRRKDFDAPGGRSGHQSRDSSHTKPEVKSGNAERRAVLEALQEQVRAKVEELRMAQETGKRGLTGPVLHSLADKVRMQEVYDLQTSGRQRVAELSVGTA